MERYFISVDVLDHENAFIDTILKPLVEKLPHIKVSMDRITTMEMCYGSMKVISMLMTS